MIGEKWTGPLLAKWIKKENRLHYQKAQIYNLLEKVGIAFEKKAGLISKAQLFNKLSPKVTENHFAKKDAATFGITFTPLLE